MGKITDIYCIADDFCKEFAFEFKKLKTLPDAGKKASYVDSTSTFQA